MKIWREFLFLAVLSSLQACSHTGTKGDAAKGPSGEKSTLSPDIDGQPYLYGSRYLAPKNNVVAFEPAVRPVIVVQKSHDRVRVQMDYSLPPIVDGPTVDETLQDNKNTAWDRYCRGEDVSVEELRIIDASTVPAHWKDKCLGLK